MNGSSTEWAWRWWIAIVSINAVNLLACAVVYRRSLNPTDGQDATYRRSMRIMGVVFTLVAVYRAVFVSRYLSQLAWFDSIANSSLLIRIFAVFAELSFSGLVALAMLRVERDLPSQRAAHSTGLLALITSRSPYFLVVCIFLAQFFATGGLITKNITLFAIEETLWTLGFLSVLPLAMIQRKRVFSKKDERDATRLKMLRSATNLIVVWCLVYCCYGLFYHLPFETWAGAIEQMRTRVPAIKGGVKAVSDALLIVNESKALKDWGLGFLFWHSAYFTVLVWISIFLMRAPRIKNGN